MNKHLISSILVVLLAATSCVKARAAQQLFITQPLVIDNNAESVASIANNNLRVSYMRCDGGGLACSMEVKVDGKWKTFGSPIEDNKVFIITGPQTTKRPTYKEYYPTWANDGNMSTNPFASGSVCEAIPVKAYNDGNTIKVEYATAGDHTVTGTWQLDNDARSAKLTIDFTPTISGNYSIGVMGLHATLPAATNNILLPPMYQYSRIPAAPEMLLSAMMPTPVAMVETTAGKKAMTAFVSADNTIAPLDWGGVDYSPIGFSILNHTNMVQPTAFSPVLGMNDSQVQAGSSISRSFVIGLTDMPWNETLEYVTTNIYNVTDYRHQPDKSLTETMYSIIDLMCDDDAGGWDTSMRGFYDIEGEPTKAPTVVHSAPLAIISAAINASDEDMYIKRALPTIEYTLSRKGFRWSTRPTDKGYNKDPETLRLSPAGSQFATTYYEGLNRLLGGRNAWITDIALPDGDIRRPRGYSSTILTWVQALYAYRLTGDNKWLDMAVSTADRDAKMHIYSNSKKPMRYQAFYNSTMYAAWWDFIDLYETTGNRQFLDAARYGAAHTLAGIRCWPQVHDSIQTIHKDDVYNGNATMWWKGSEQYRLGFPRTKGDAPEHDVEQWRVSPVGLGFEQPSTYFLRNKGKLVRPVFMSSWAPSLLRLNALTGIDIFNTYARNAVIGRFTNYPGYYATGYTDLTMSEDFPYKGPDVSSIYYHHIPPHLAFTADYLVTEAIQRSRGNVSFPYGKQEGFVWFSNRIYGGEPGRIFDDNRATLWLKKGLIDSSNPEINFLTAISDTRFWILLCNESDQPQTTSIGLGSEVAALAQSNTATSITDYKSRKRLDNQNGKFTLDIAPKGFAAIALPVNASALADNKSLQALLNYSSTPTLKNGYKILSSGTNAGNVHLYRIRSPFGWDSVYGFCETPPADGISVTARCGEQLIECNSYPYEWSFLKFNPKEQISVAVDITDTSGETKTINIEI